MKLVLVKEKFLAGLQTVQNVISSRSTLPVLSNILIKATDGKLTLAATDLDTGIRTEVEAKIDKAGSITLPAKKLFTIVRDLPADELVFESDGKQHATIKSGSFSTKLLGIAEDDFPPFPSSQGQKVFKIDQKIFKEMLKSTSYAVSTDESRYVLNGALLSFKEGKLTVVATDGRRLALVDQELEFPAENAVDIILPTKAVSELQRILKDEGQLTIGVADNQITFDIGTVFLVSKLIEGNYPNYKQVIPAETKERVILERLPFLNAVRRVALVASDKSNSVKLHFGKNNLDISANTPEVGEAKESIPVNYKGREITIAFNPDYLCDPLKTVEIDEVFLDLTDELSPGIIRNKNPFLYVIMPMRTG